MLEKHFTSMVHAALLLYRKLTVMLKSCTPHYVDVLKASISLILFAVAQLKTLCPSDENTKGAFASLKGTLWNWIVNREVIGGSVFGGNLPACYSSGMWLWNPRGELEVCATQMLYYSRVTLRLQLFELLKNKLATLFTCVCNKSQPFAKSLITNYVCICLSLSLCNDVLKYFLPESNVCTMQPFGLPKHLHYFLDAHARVDIYRHIVSSHVQDYLSSLQK